MKSNKCEIEPLERSKQSISHGISLALVSTLLCARKYNKNDINNSKS